MEAPLDSTGSLEAMFSSLSLPAKPKNPPDWFAARIWTCAFRMAEIGALKPMRRCAILLALVAVASTSQDISHDLPYVSIDVRKAPLAPRTFSCRQR